MLLFKSIGEGQATLHEVPEILRKLLPKKPKFLQYKQISLGHFQLTADHVDDKKDRDSESLKPVHSRASNRKPYTY